MADQSASSHDWTVIGLGSLTATMGIYFSLAGLGLVPEPSPRSANTPAWIALVVGLVFSTAGLAVILRGLAGADDKSGDLPAATPRWLTAIYLLLGLAATCGLAAMGTWVAFGAGPRHFIMSGSIGGSVGDTIGRIAFGIGAIIAWLIVAAMAYGGAKKIFGGKP